MNTADRTADVSVPYYSHSPEAQSLHQIIFISSDQLANRAKSQFVGSAWNMHLQLLINLLINKALMQEVEIYWKVCDTEMFCSW